MQNIYSEKFYKAVNFLQDCSDVVIKNEFSVIIETGLELARDHLITYHFKDNKINFYLNKDLDLLLSIDEYSPLIVMFDALIYQMDNDY